MELKLKKRKYLLGEILKMILENDVSISEDLLKLINIHMKICDNPKKWRKIESIHLNVNQMIEKYSPFVDLIEKSTFTNDICPLTQSEIEDRWVSACGHSFENSAVSAYMEHNLNCPVIGCKKKLMKK